MNFNQRVMVVAVFLFCTFALRAWVSGASPAPSRLAFAQFPNEIGSWKMTGSSNLDDEVAGILKADDYLLRRYSDGNGHTVDFFIAYYKAQQAGESMHSPKNCLPGAGWVPVINDMVTLEKDSQGNPVKVNRYVIEKDADRALAVYWYQADGRVIANEYWGKVYLVWDSLRTGRRDGAIIRIFIPISKSQKGAEQALKTALEFARSAKPLLPAFLPD